jgi:hypothetical protein
MMPKSPSYSRRQMIATAAGILTTGRNIKVPQTLTPLRPRPRP